MPAPPFALSFPVRATAFAIVLLGATLRLWGNDTAVPFRMGVDEPAILSTALRMIKTADFHPHFFDYGGLTLYLHAAVGTAAFLGGAMDGRVPNLNAFWEGDMLVAGRTVTGLLGALTVFLVFRIGLRWGSTVALLAALLMAVLPAHVREAHFILTDTPLTLFITLALLLSMRGVEERTLGAVALAGMAVGLAGAIKYNGAVALLMPLVAALTLPYGRRIAGLCVASLSAGVTFLVCAPYTILALPDFLNRFAALMNVYSRERSVTEVLLNYVAHLRNWFTWPGVLPAQFGYLSIAFALSGWAWLISRARTQATVAFAALIIVFPVVYFWFISSQALQYGRYLLPIGPMLCVGLAIGVSTLSSRLGARWPTLRPIVVPALVFLLMGAPTVSGLAWLRTHTRISTSEQAAEWLVAQGLRPERIVVEEAVSVHLPPPLVVTKTRELVSRHVDDYRRDNVTYLVASSIQTDRYYADPSTYRDQIAAYQTMMALTEPVATFSATADHPGATVTVLRVRP